jgi:DNA-binding NarL/FixJ family response regulator
MAKLRILLADDHEIVRRGIRSLLLTHPDWEVCAEASNGREAVEQTLRLKPDIVLIDISMPVMNGLEATGLIVRQIPDQRVLILTMYDNERLFHDVIQAGAKGVLLKTDASLDLIRAVEALQQHKTFLTAKLARARISCRTRSDHLLVQETLTPRELEVTRLLAEGLSSRQVAMVLSISVKTAQTHRSNIMRKLDIHSISELVLYAARNNVIQVLPLGSELPSTEEEKT